MKLILTGATRFVGGEVLQRLAAKTGIEEITCLARRAPEALPPKATVILHDDFTRYDAPLLERLAGHAACI
jgi:nucleoside-diphosphate-sugar epimerase